MRLHRASRHLTAWIACLAVLLGALAPAVTHALQAGGTGSWVEVCTAQGSRWVRADGAGTHDAAPGHESGHQHCAYCWLQAGKPGLPATAPAWQPPAGPGHAAPHLTGPGSTAPPPRPAAQPRAPPHLS
jgi:hypothetical protein